MSLNFSSPMNTTARSESTPMPPSAQQLQDNHHIRSSSQEPQSGPRRPGARINSNNIHFIPKETIGIHMALEDLLRNHKVAIGSQIKTLIEQKYQKTVAELREKNSGLEQQNNELKTAINDAISKMIYSENERDQYAKEVLRAHTANVELMAENEKQKEELRRKDLYISSMQHHHYGIPHNGVEYQQQFGAMETNNNMGPVIIGNQQQHGTYHQ